MKVIRSRPLALTVELNPTDCIALLDACYSRADDWDDGNASPLLGAIAIALLAALVAIADQDMDEGKPTIAKVWRAWAPIIYLVQAGEDETYGRMPVNKRYAD